MREIKMLHMFKNKKAFILVVILAVLIIAVIVKSCGVSRNVSYEYEKISRGDIVKTITVSGTLNVLNSYTILSKINGVVNKVPVDFNQVVKKNQLLATIDSTELDQQKMRVLAQLDRAKLDIVGAKMELDSKRDLFKDSLISKKDLEQAELNFQKISAQLQQFRVEYNIVAKNLSYTEILSPASGTVISVLVKPTDLVGMNKPLFVVAEDLKKMYLTIQVDESDIGKINKGQKVSFTVSAFPNNTFEGKIDQVHFNPDTSSTGIVTYQAIIICNNSELLLKPGMTTTATVIVAQKINVKRVQNDAFIVAPRKIETVPGKKFVWRKSRIAVDEIPVEQVEVKTGTVGDTYTEIESESVKIGDEILIRIDKKLKIKDEI